MTAGDELLALEKKARDQGMEIAKARETMASCSRIVREKVLQLGGARLDLEKARRHIAILKAAPVTLLSEYEYALFQRDQALEALDCRRAEIKKLEKQCLDAFESLPRLERELNQTLVQIDTFGKVLPFR